MQTKALGGPTLGPTFPAKSCLPRVRTSNSHSYVPIFTDLSEAKFLRIVQLCIISACDIPVIPLPWLSFLIIPLLSGECMAPPSAATDVCIGSLSGTECVDALDGHIHRSIDGTTKVEA